LTAAPDLDRLLEDLNPSQREAVAVTSGPLAIIAGAGSGKTRVVSRRAAYAIETGAIPPDQILLVTFTDKAAGEMVERMVSLRHRGVMARTFHAAALAQLRHFWPSRHDGAPLPAVLDSKLRLLVPLIGRLPGGYRFTPAKDMADTIEWAKVRRIRPERWIRDGGDRAPIPAELFARAYRDYERSKAQAGLLDFEDMLVETVELLEGDPEAAALVRSRKRWFSVDEYQDTNPLCERLLELWLGESRDLAVVGDPDQTIYSFTGATPDFLLDFAGRHPGARTVTLTENYRSSPQILELANRLVAGGASGEPGARGALKATQPDGPPPSIRRFTEGEAEVRDIVAWIRAVGAAGVGPTETAVLVRMNAQLPAIEDALTRAGIGFTVRGQRFFDRREIREALLLLRRVRPAETGDALVAAVERLFVERLGLDDVAADAGSEGRERAASLELLLGIVEDLEVADPALTIDTVLAELDRRRVAETEASTDGVNLLTYHRAKDSPGKGGRGGCRGAPPAVRGHHSRPPLPGPVVVVAQTVAVPRRAAASSAGGGAGGTSCGTSGGAGRGAGRGTSGQSPRLARGTDGHGPNTRRWASRRPASLAPPARHGRRRAGVCRRPRHHAGRDRR
jgi:DNA helicase-2/ATP-dependent DNA helicase PcrA